MYQKEDDILSFIEITFQNFGHPVLYCEPHSLDLRKKIDYPTYLVKSYQQFAQNIALQLENKELK